MSADNHNKNTPADPLPSETPPANGNVPRKRSSRLRRWIYALTASTALGTGTLAYVEHETSWLQSRIFGEVAAGTKNATEKSNRDELPQATGPYDMRLGYARTADIRDRLTQNGYQIKGETLWQDRTFMGMTLPPIFNEKAQAGLTLSDETGTVLSRYQYPQQVYASYEDIPPVLVKSLLYVENRELMEDHPGTWNPAIDWTRTAKAGMDYALRQLGMETERSGGSTLAVQIEKFKHSDGGMTDSPQEKLRQMATASIRAYQYGTEDTTQARHDIVLNYFNAMPLSAYNGFGEVNGFADGLSLWFGHDVDNVNTLLRKSESDMTDDEFTQAAQAYRDSLALIMAVQKPSAYLRFDRDSLEQRIDNYLPSLVRGGIISDQMAQEVRKHRSNFNTERHATTEPHEKSVQSLEIELMKTLGLDSLYALKRTDVSARTSIDGDVSRAVSSKLKSLSDPDVAKEVGITGYRLLNAERLDEVIYTFTLYEKTDNANILRVQTDNYNGQLNLNEGSKLELGSTAKLRTLISYLEAVEDLHQTYSMADRTALAQVQTHPKDDLTRWAINYLSTPDANRSLNAMLEAAMNRRYSANPWEQFYTGGGLHTFNNFNDKDNRRTMTVQEAFYRSVNLPFVRMMQDVVMHTQTHKMNIAPNIFENRQSPMRQEYLKRFADMEGKTFLWQFWEEQRDIAPKNLAEYLAQKTHKTAAHLAVVYRTLHPNAPFNDFTSFANNLTDNGFDGKGDDLAKAYRDYAPGSFDLNDLGYITDLHPLELWLGAEKIKNKDLTWSGAVDASTQTRQHVYEWLFKSSRTVAQNIRIRRMLEKEAFEHIHQGWVEKGFPFSRMMDSYAAALGASGDTPSALAELSGILQNGGLRKPTLRFLSIEFAKNTPYETFFKRNPKPAKQVLSPAIAELVQRELQGVAEHGTARRAHGSVKLADGTPLPVGGKTGTGDNRIETYARNGTVLTSDVKSRTAAFVFTIDDRFFGSVIAYVPGDQAADHDFTSALPVQVFKSVVSDIQPILNRAYDIPQPTQPATKVVGAFTPPNPKL